MDVPIITWNRVKKCAEVNGKLAFTFYSQYGFPVEMFEEMVNERFKRGGENLNRLIIKSYNDANGTNFQLI